MTNLEIANSALIKLGQEKISSYPDTTTKRGITISEQFSKVLKRILRDHSWNFACKRVKLSLEQHEIESTDVSVANNTFSKTSHGFITGLKVQVANSDTLPAPLAASTDYYVIKSSVDTFKLATSLSNALAGTAIDITTAGSGTNKFYPQDATPEFEFDYQFTVPSDYHKLIKVTYDDTGKKNIDYKFEGKKILSNYQVIFLNYVALETDPGNFTDDFSELFALLLASECAYDLVQNKELKAQLEEMYNKRLAEVRFNDGFEGSSEPMQVDYYIDQRY